MLEVGKTYFLDKRSLRVTEYVAQGSVARIFRVSLISDRGEHNLAAKVSIRPDLNKYLQEEYQTIQAILEHYTNHPRPPIPDYAELVKVNDNGTETSILLMEFIDTPELFDVYQNHVRDLPTDDLKKRLEAERLAWESASQYLDLLQKLLFTVHINTADRKRDAFRWLPAQNGKLHEGHLIVIDWNAIEKLPDKPDLKIVLDTLKLFAQNWYVMLTQQRPGLPPSLYADDTWRYISLAGRKFLLDLLNPPAQFFVTSTPQAIIETVIKRVRSLVELLDESSPTLRSQYAQMSETQNDTDGWLFLADVARRIPGDLQSTARAEYLRLIRRRSIQGDNPQISIWRLNVLNTSGVAQRHEKLLNEFKTFVTENSQAMESNGLAKTVESLIQTLDKMQKFPPSSQYAQNFGSQISELRRKTEDILGNSVFDDKFTEMLKVHKLYSLAAIINEQLKGFTENREDNTFFKVHENLVQLREQAQNPANRRALDYLEINTEAVEDLDSRLSHLNKGLHEHLVYSIRERFIEACQRSEYAKLHMEIEQALLSPLTNRSASEVLITYLDTLASAEKFTYIIPVTDSGQRALLTELIDFVEAFPLLRAWAQQLPFVDTAQQHYRRLKSPIMQAISEPGFEKQSINPIEMQRTLQLARLLRDLFAF